MGGTFKEMVFSDRDSDYPSRRKLIKISEQENIYDVSRAEGTVRNEGTPFNAKTLNDFQDNISSMFPVTVTNGGTGATTAQQARTNLGIPITYGDFSAHIYSTNDLNSSVYMYSGSNHIGRYYRIANLVNCSIYLHHVKLALIVTGYVAIGHLPFANSSGIDVAATVSEFAVYNNNNSTDRTIKVTGILRNNERVIRIYKDDGGIAYPMSLLYSNSSANTLDATLSVTYSLS